jgi:hypothetical protein
VGERCGDIRSSPAIISRGYAIENHLSGIHGVSFQRPRGMAQEIRRAQDSIREVTGRRRVLPSAGRTAQSVSRPLAHANLTLGLAGRAAALTPLTAIRTWCSRG